MSLARQGVGQRDERAMRLRRDLERELAEKAEKIRHFQKKMYDQLERLATDMDALRKEIAG